MIRKQLNEIVKNHILAYEKIRLNIHDGTNAVFIKLTKDIINLFKKEVSRKSYIGDIDVNLYKVVHNLAKEYEKLLLDYTEKEMALEGLNDKNIKIINTLNEIIEKIKRQHIAVRSIVNLDENPINKEKKELIIMECEDLINLIFIYKKGIEHTIINEIMYKIKNNKGKAAREIEKVINQDEIVRRIKDEINIDDLHELLNIKIKKMTFILDDLDNRMIAGQYFVYIKMQNELLTNVMELELLEVKSWIKKEKLICKEGELIRETYDKIIKITKIVNAEVTKINNIFSLKLLEKEVKKEKIEKMLEIDKNEINFYNKLSKLKEEINYIQGLEAGSIELIKKNISQSEKLESKSSEAYKHLQRIKRIGTVINKIVEICIKNTIFFETNLIYLEKEKNYREVINIGLLIESIIRNLENNKYKLENETKYMIEKLTEGMEEAIVELPTEEVFNFFVQLDSMDKTNVNLKKLYKNIDCTITYEDINLKQLSDKIEKRISKYLYEVKEKLGELTSKEMKNGITNCKLGTDKYSKIYAKTVEQNIENIENIAKQIL